MDDQQAAPLYWVWGGDTIAYGPFELPALVNWIQGGRATDQSWVFCGELGDWVRAAQVSELKMLFTGGETASHPPGPKAKTLKAANLRRIKLFADMEGAQLESLLSYMEVVKVKKFAQLFHKGDEGDAMYFVMEGEVRASTIIDGKETTLFTMGVGDSFGEMALLIQGPRSADIVTNEDSVLLKLPAEAFEKIVREAPALATPFLLAIARMITHRSLDIGKKYERSIRSARLTAEMRV